MWRELFASAGTRGFSATRKAGAPEAGTVGRQGDTVSSPQDWSGPPPPAPVAPAPPQAPVAPAVAAPADVSRETSEESDTPIGAAAERAMRVLHTTYTPLRRPRHRRLFTIANQKGGVGKTTLGATSPP